MPPTHALAARHNHARRTHPPPQFPFHFAVSLAPPHLAPLSATPHRATLRHAMPRSYCILEPLSMIPLYCSTVASLSPLFPFIMLHFYCSAVEYLSLDRINNTCVGLVGGQRIVFPLFPACVLLSSLATSRLPPTVQATALLQDIGLELNISYFRWTPLSSFTLSLAPP